MARMTDERIIWRVCFVSIVLMFRAWKILFCSNCDRIPYHRQNCSAVEMTPF